MQPAKPSQAQLAICDVSAESVTAVLWHAGKREEGEGGGSGGHAGLRLLSALLTEMDGMELATGEVPLLLLLLLPVLHLLLVLVLLRHMRLLSCSTSMRSCMRGSQLVSIR